MTDAEFRAAQNHTGEHIISGLVHNTFGYDNVGYHAANGVTTADFSGELSFEQALEIEKRANEVIREDIPVEVFFPTAEEIPKLNFRAKLELDQMPELRLVRIGDVDLCACSAGHVKSTGQVGLIKIISAERHRGGTRVNMTAGPDALELFNVYQKNVTEISNTLSAPREEVSAWVEKLKTERDELKYNLTASELELIKHLPIDDCCVFTSLSDLAQREYCNILMEHHPVAAVFSGEKYIIGSKTVNLRDKSAEINAAIDGRGGGRPEMISGTAKADSQKIHNYFVTFCSKVM